MRAGSIAILLLLMCLAVRSEDAVRVLIVVPSNLTATANTACQRWHTNFWGIQRGTNSQVFTASLTTNVYGTNPITHYWCNWAMSSNEWWWFTNKLTVVGTPNIKVFNAATTTPDQVLQDLGLFRMQTNP